MTSVVVTVCHSVCDGFTCCLTTKVEEEPRTKCSASPASELAFTSESYAWTGFRIMDRICSRYTEVVCNFVLEPRIMVLTSNTKLQTTCVVATNAVPIEKFKVHGMYVALAKYMYCYLSWFYISSLVWEAVCWAGSPRTSPRCPYYIVCPLWLVSVGTPLRCCAGFSDQADTVLAVYSGSTAAYRRS